MRTLPFLLRFVLSVIVASSLVSCAGRIFSDFDEPSQNDPHDLVRGIGVWTVAILIAVLNELLMRRRSKEDLP